MNRLIQVTRGLIVLASALIIFGAGTIVGIRLVPLRKVLAVQNSRGNVQLLVVTYNDGISEVAMKDGDHRQRRYSFEIPSQLDHQTKGIFIPTVVRQGESWQRMVVTYDDAGEPGCQRHIAHIGRLEERLSFMDAPGCIVLTLDEGASSYLSVSQDGETYAVGRYQSGVPLATHESIKGPDGRSIGATVTSNTDATRIVLVTKAFPSVPPQLFYWNLVDGSWHRIEMPSEKNWHPGAQAAHDPEHDIFVMNGTTSSKGKIVDKSLPLVLPATTPKAGSHSGELPTKY